MQNIPPWLAELHFGPCLALSCLLVEDKSISMWLQVYIYLLQFEDEPAAARWGSADLFPSGVCLFLESTALNSTSNAVTSKWPCCSPCGWAWELPSLIHYGLNASLDQESNSEHHTHLNMQMITCSAVFQIAFVIAA